MLLLHVRPIAKPMQKQPNSNMLLHCYQLIFWNLLNLILRCKLLAEGRSNILSRIRTRIKFYTSKCYIYSKKYLYCLGLQKLYATPCYLFWLWVDLIKVKLIVEEPELGFLKLQSGNTGHSDITKTQTYANVIFIVQNLHENYENNFFFQCTSFVNTYQSN
jgi:hypothetical protein